MSGEELEEAGLPGPSTIRNVLSKPKKTHTLVNAINKFQVEHGIKSDVMEPALKILDMHSIPRTDIYENVPSPLVSASISPQMISAVSDQLITKLRNLGTDSTPASKEKLRKQLEKSFKMYRIPQIRPLVLETLKQIPDLDDEHIALIMDDPQLYEDCAVPVKRQVWTRHEDLYVKAVQPVIEQYVSAKRAVLCTVDPSMTNYFSSETTKSRRQNEHVQTLLAMFGEFEPLYIKMMSMIREEYRITGDAVYCSLKEELIMAAHEANVEAVTRNDKAHELAWCLDMCLRDKHIDTQQNTRIKNALETTRKHSVEVLGDIAMVAADPHVVHFLCTMGVKIMRDSSGHIPRESSGFQLIIRLLTIGSVAHKIVAGEDVNPQMVEVIFFTKFLPSMASLVLEDIMRAELAKNDRADEAESMGLYSQPSNLILTFLKTEAAAALLWIHYTLDLLPRRSLDIRGMLRYLQLMPLLKDHLGTRSPWSHLFMHRLVCAPLVDTLVNDSDVMTIIIDQLFFASLKTDLYHKYQLLRLVSQCHRFLHSSILAAIMDSINPSSMARSVDKERYEEVYNRVVVKASPPPQSLREYLQIAPKEEEVATPRAAFVAPLQTPHPSATPSGIMSTPSHSFDY